MKYFFRKIRLFIFFALVHWKINGNRMWKKYATHGRTDENHHKSAIFCPGGAQSGRRRALRQRGKEGATGSRFPSHMEITRPERFFRFPVPPSSGLRWHRIISFFLILSKNLPKIRTKFKQNLNKIFQKFTKIWAKIFQKFKIISK